MSYFELIGVNKNIKYLVVGGMVMSAKSEKHKNDDVSGFGKMNPKFINPNKMKQNNYTELLGYSLRIIAVIAVTTPDPTSSFVPGFPAFPMGNRIVSFERWPTIKVEHHSR